MAISPQTKAAVWSILAAAVALVAGPVLAQSIHVATLTGTVVLSTGETIAGVPVAVTSPALVSGERLTTSNQEGRFVFLSLPPGTYELTAQLEGFSTVSMPGIMLNAGDKQDVQISLERGIFEDAIVVSGAAPLIDNRSSTQDTTFTDEMLAKLPTARNPFYDLAVTAPGMASVGSDESWLPSPSAFGSAANENIFLVNGVNATNPRGAPWGSLVSVNYNTVQEVKVLALGSKAEYGSFSGAAIDVLTKSGGNDFAGDVAYYSQVGSAADNSTTSFGDDLFYADPADDLTTTPEDSSEASLTLGGPILKNRVWFYAGYSQTDAETDTPLFEPLSLYESELWDLKVTGELGPSHRAWLAYHHEDLEAGNNSWGATWDSSMVYNQPQDNDTLQFQYQWVMSANDLISAKFLGFETEQTPSIPNQFGHPGYINWWKWIGSQSIGLNGDFPYVEAQKSERQTLQADITHYAEDFLGEHEMKFGVQYTRAEGNWQGGYFHGYANFAYPYPYNYGPAQNWWWNCSYDWCWGSDENPVFPMYLNQITRNPWLTVRKSDSTGAFADDTWILNDRVTLNLGLRYDRMTAKYGEGKVFELPETPGDIANPTVLRTREGTGNVFDFETWSPRVGVAWTLTEDQRTVLRAHVGRYYAPLGVEALRRFGPDMEPSLTETFFFLLPLSEVDLNGNGMIDFDEVRPATRLLEGRTPDWLQSSSINDPSWELEVADGTKSPSTDQFTVSVQRQIGSNLAVEAGYIFKETNDLLALRPYNTQTGEFYDWVSRPFTTFTGFETSVWEIARNDYNGDGIFDREDAQFVLDNTRYRVVNMDDFVGQSVDRTYHGLQVVMNKRYSNRWQGLGAVNWNDSDGIAPRTVDQNWYIDAPLVMDTPFGSTFNHFQNNLSGPVPMTPEWMVKVSGSYTLPVVETDLGVRVRYDSGRALFPVQGLNTFASWMPDLQPGVLVGTAWHEFIVADDPDQADWLPPTTIVDLGLSKTFQIAGDYGLGVSFDVLNAFNEDAPNRVGFKQGDYGRVYGLVQPRWYRAGVKLSF